MPVGKLGARLGSLGLLGGVSRYTAGQAATLTRLKTAAASALISNPVDNADMASPPTITQSGTHDATLSVRSNPQTNPTVFRASAGSKHIQTATNGLFVGTASDYPATSALNALAAQLSPSLANVGEEQICYTVDFVTVGQIVELEFRNANGSTIPYRVIVNDQFVARDGVFTGSGVFVKMDFGSSATRRITVDVQFSGSLRGVSVSAGGSVNAPSDAVYKGIVYGDSITESFSSGETNYYVFDGWFSTFCKRVGINSAQNAAVGATGYWNTASGTRSKLYDQMPYTISGDTFDLVALFDGYNDQGAVAVATMQAEFLACLQRARLNQPNALILAGGIFGSRTGPSATLITAENALLSTFNAWGDRFARFIPISTDGIGWLNGTGYVGATNGSGNSDIYVSSDGVHPNRAGRIYLGGKANTAYRALLAAM